jgi:regulatory protein
LFTVASEDAGAGGADWSKAVDEAREICLRQLHGRAHTSGELAAILRRKGVSDEVAEAALGRLAEVGLVDDVRFARDWIERHGSGKSRWILQRELVRKGIDALVVGQLIEEIPEPDGIERSIVVRRWSSLRELPEEVQVRRAAGLLTRRGFDPGSAATVVAQLRAEEETPVAERW